MFYVNKLIKLIVDLYLKKRLDYYNIIMMVVVIIIVVIILF